MFPSHHGGFLGGEFGYPGQPKAFPRRPRDRRESINCWTYPILLTGIVLIDAVDRGRPPGGQDAIAALGNLIRRKPQVVLRKDRRVSVRSASAEVKAGDQGRW